MSITINGDCIGSYVGTGSKNIYNIRTGDKTVKIFINNELIKEYKGKLTIVVEGDINFISGPSFTVNGNVGGNVDGTSINCGDVKGNVDGANVQCGHVYGSVKAAIVTHS